MGLYATDIIKPDGEVAIMIIDGNKTEYPVKVISENEAAHLALSIIASLDSREGANGATWTWLEAQLKTQLKHRDQQKAKSKLKN